MLIFNRDDWEEAIVCLFVIPTILLLFMRHSTLWTTQSLEQPKHATWNVLEPGRSRICTKQDSQVISTSAIGVVS